jgi:hypothetical protein
VEGRGGRLFKYYPRHLKGPKKTTNVLGQGRLPYRCWNGLSQKYKTDAEPAEATFSLCYKKLDFNYFGIFNFTYELFTSPCTVAVTLLGLYEKWWF